MEDQPGHHVGGGRQLRHQRRASAAAGQYRRGVGPAGRLAAVRGHGHVLRRAGGAAADDQRGRPGGPRQPAPGRHARSGGTAQRRGAAGDGAHAGRRAGGRRGGIQHGPGLPARRRRRASRTGRPGARRGGARRAAHQPHPQRGRRGRGRRRRGAGGRPPHRLRHGAVAPQMHDAGQLGQERRHAGQHRPRPRRWRRRGAGHLPVSGQLHHPDTRARRPDRRHPHHLVDPASRMRGPVAGRDRRALGLRRGHGGAPPVPGGRDLLRHGRERGAPHLPARMLHGRLGWPAQRCPSAPTPVGQFHARAGPLRARSRTADAGGRRGQDDRAAGARVRPG